MTDEPSYTEVILSNLRHDVKWLLEISNTDPQSFIGREEELYSIMNVVQLVTGRFSKVAPPIRRTLPPYRIHESNGQLGEVGQVRVVADMGARPMSPAGVAPGPLDTDDAGVAPSNDSSLDAQLRLVSDALNALPGGVG